MVARQSPAMNEEQPKEVFISYSSKDRVLAEALLARLETEGFTCWIAPRDIRPGDSFSGAIVEAISRVRAMVLLFSSRSNQSKHCLAEVERAFSAGIPILPFRLEQLVPSPDLEYFLSTSQWLDAFSGSMDRHMDQLVQALRPLVHRDGGPAASAAPVTPAARRAARSQRRMMTIVGTVVSVALGLSAIGLLAWMASFDRKKHEAEAATPAAIAKLENGVATARAAAGWAGAGDGELAPAAGLAGEFQKAAAAKNLAKADALAPRAAAAYAEAALAASRKPGLDDDALRSALRAMIELQGILPADSKTAADCAARAEELREETAVTNSLGMRFVYVPTGRFLMGSPTGEEKSESDDDERQHQRSVDGFYMQDHEVTREQFAAFVFSTSYLTDAERHGVAAVRVGTLPPWQDLKFKEGERAYTWRTPLIQQGDKHPVVLVTWNDAVAFCDWLSAKEGRKYRLPSEAEWEYACRAGSTTPFYTGASISAKDANFCDDNTGYPLGSPVSGIFLKNTTPVGKYPPNRFGLFDMHGNVWEWCQDPYSKIYPGIGGEEDSGGELTGEYVRRGGGWASNPITLRSANRWKLAPDYAREDSGFRIVLAGDQVPE